MFVTFGDERVKWLRTGFLSIAGDQVICRSVREPENIGNDDGRDESGRILENFSVRLYSGLQNM